MNTFETGIEKSRIRYHDIQGNGSPLIFIHGLGCASSCDYPRIASDPALLGRRMLWAICWDRASAIAPRHSATRSRTMLGQWLHWRGTFRSHRLISLAT